MRSKIKWLDNLTDEGGRPYFVTLKEGFAFRDNNVDDAALHCSGFDTKVEMNAAVQRAKPCTCKRCKS